MYLGQYFGKYEGFYFGGQADAQPQLLGSFGWNYTKQKKKSTKQEIEDLVNEYLGVLTSLSQPIHEVVEKIEQPTKKDAAQKVVIARNLSETALTADQIESIIKAAEQEYLRNVMLLIESEDEACILSLLN